MSGQQEDRTQWPKNRGIAGHNGFMQAKRNQMKAKTAEKKAYWEDEVRNKLSAAWKEADQKAGLEKVAKEAREAENEVDDTMFQIENLAKHAIQCSARARALRARQDDMTQVGDNLNFNFVL